MPRTLSALLLLSAALGLAACAGSGESTTGSSAAPPEKLVIPAQPESGKLKLATSAWIGYGPYTVAQKKGLFTRRGLNVDIVNFPGDKQINSALASGRVDAANSGIPAAMVMVGAGIPVHIVMFEDLSRKADGIIAAPAIKSLSQLKGKRVAVSQGTLQEIELDYALSMAGLKRSDVRDVNIDPDQSGGAILAGKLDAAVTYEPFISAAQRAGANTLFTAGEKPGLVGDALVVRDEVIRDRPGQVAALIRAWQDALDYYGRRTADAQAIISRDLGVKPADLKSSFDGVDFYSVADSAEQLSGAYFPTFKIVAAAAKRAGLTNREVAPGEAIDARFAEQLAK